MLSLSTSLLAQVLTKEIIDFGRLDLILDTSTLLLTDQRLFLLGNSTALFILKHEAISSQLGLRKNALSSSLEVRALLSIEISTETSSLISEDQMVSLNLQPLSISKNFKAILVGVDGVNSILKLSNIGFLDFSLLFFKKRLVFLLLTINLDGSLYTTRVSGLFGDLNFKLLTINNQFDNMILLVLHGSDNNSWSGRLFSKDNMFTVIDRIVIVLTIKGPDVAGFNIARGGHSSISKPLSNLMDKRLSSANRQELFSIPSHREISDIDFLTITLNSDRKEFTISINFSLNFIFSLGTSRSPFQMLLGKIGKEIKLSSISGKLNKSVLRNLFRKRKFSMDTVKVRSHMDSSSARFSQFSVFFIILGTLLELLRLRNKLMEFIRSEDNKRASDGPRFFTLETIFSFNGHLGGQVRSQNFLLLPFLFWSSDLSISRNFSFKWSSQLGRLNIHLHQNFSFFFSLSTFKSGLLTNGN